jgi:hypothetical protein
MPNSAANLYSASSSHQTETPGVDSGPGAQPRVPPTHQSHHHGAGIADSTPATTLPPLTPATTTRQSVPLGVHSTLWGGTTTPTSNAHSIPLLDPSTPAIVTHAPSPEEPSSDLTSSVPSTTTTLTNTLPPTQSAALRARLPVPGLVQHQKQACKVHVESNHTIQSARRSTHLLGLTS